MKIETNRQGKQSLFQYPFTTSGLENGACLFLQPRSPHGAGAESLVTRYLDLKRRLTDKEVFFRLWSVTVELATALCS